MQVSKNKKRVTTGWEEIEITEINDLLAMTMKRTRGGFFCSGYDTLELLDRDDTIKSVSFPEIPINKINFKNDDNLPNVKARLEEKKRFHVPPLEFGGGSSLDSRTMTLVISGATEKINRAKQTLFTQGHAIFN